MAKHGAKWRWEAWARAVGHLEIFDPRSTEAVKAAFELEPFRARVSKVEKQNTHGEKYWANEITHFFPELEPGDRETIEDWRIVRARERDRKHSELADWETGPGLR